MTFAISWSDCVLVRVREFVRAWAEISGDKAERRAEWCRDVASLTLVAVNEPQHAMHAVKLAGFSFRWSHAQEIARKRSFSLRTTNWISTPLCNDAGDKLYRLRN